MMLSLRVQARCVSPSNPSRIHLFQVVRHGQRSGKVRAGRNISLLRENSLFGLAADEMFEEMQYPNSIFFTSLGLWEPRVFGLRLGSGGFL
jgi:hypothetical protein